MDRISHDLARVRHQELEREARQRVAAGDLRRYRGVSDAVRFIRLPRR